MIADTAKVTRCAELIQTSVDNELVMMDVSSGDCFGISGVGTRIWEMLDGTRSLNDVVSEVCSEYDVSEEVCRQDVEEFIARLNELKLINYT